MAVWSEIRNKDRKVLYILVAQFEDRVTFLYCPEEFELYTFGRERALLESQDL